MAKTQPEWYDSLLDRLDALKVLRADDEDTKGALLEEIAELGEPERDIARELLASEPLAEPERFEEAHRRAMRGLEVLERNGGREVVVKKLGPLGAPASALVSPLAGWITTRYAHSLVDEIRGLYETREANAAPGSDEHRMLRRARLQASIVEQGFGNPRFGVPGFLLGGAAVSTAFASVHQALGSAFESTLGTVVVSLIFVAIVLALSWAFLYAAAVARRRIRLSTDRPARRLWQAIGACGDPPRDHSLGFAVLAIVLLLLAWLAIPAIIWLLVG